MTKEKLLDLDKKQLDILKEIITQHIPDKTVWVYGSRVTWKADEASDIDLTVFDCTNIQIDELKETLEESDLLISVDVMNWEEIPDNFKTNIKKQYVVLQEKNTLEGWREVKLGEVGKLARGKSKHRPRWAWHLFGGKYPFIQTGQIKSAHKYIKTYEQTYSEAGLSQSKLWEKNTLCITIAANIAEIAILEFPACFPDSVLGFIANDQKCDLDFIYYNFTIVQAKLRQLAIGSVQDNINLGTFESLQFFLPPLPEQKAIAEVLSSLDDKIDLLHRQNKTLENMAQTLFRQWFVEQADAGWERKKLGDFITPKKGKNITKSQAYFGVYPVIAGGLSPSCYHNKCNTQAPVITISASGANAGFVNLHHTSVWSSDSSYIDYSITPYVYFFYIFLKRNQILITDKQEGSVQPHIYPSHLMDLDVFNYSEKLIQKFENYCIDIFNKIKANQSQINTLENLRDTLLPKLMSSEVRLQTNKRGC